MESNEVYYFKQFRKLFELSSALDPVKVGRDIYYVDRNHGGFFYLLGDDIISQEMSYSVHVKNPITCEPFLTRLFTITEMFKLKARVGSDGKVIVSLKLSSSALPVDLCVVKFPFTQTYVCQYLAKCYLERKEPTYDFQEMFNMRRKGVVDDEGFMSAILENIAKMDWVDESPLSCTEDDLKNPTICLSNLPT